jgi:hypothetical protein
VQEKEQKEQELQEQMPVSEGEQGQENMNEATVPEQKAVTDQQASESAAPDQGQAAENEQLQASQENMAEADAPEQEAAETVASDQEQAAENGLSVSQEQDQADEQAARVGPEYQDDGVEPELAAAETPEWEVPDSGGQEQEIAASQQEPLPADGPQQGQESQAETVPAAEIQGSAPAAEPAQETNQEQSGPVRPSMTVTQYMEYFQLDRFPREMVEDFKQQISDNALRRQAARLQRQSAEPAEAPVPLRVRITSLEMDGSTRAFAAAEYGDLSINRIRVKEDEYGTLSVTMPKYRKAGGWDETCRFRTADAKNRLSGAVLDAYDQALAHLQGQRQDQGEAPDQGGPVMSMS